MRRTSQNTGAAKAIRLADEAASRCHNIKALAELLATAAESDNVGALELEVVAHVGHMISEDVHKLHTLLRLFAKQAGQVSCQF